MGDELIFYVLGVATPFIGLISWKLLAWFVESQVKPKMPSLNLSKKSKKTGCPECGSVARHHKDCSLNPEKKKA